MSATPFPQLERQVVVRLARLADWDGKLAFVDGILDAEQRARAVRFRFPEDRARFLLGRALLARSLREFAGVSTAPLKLRLTEQGRPVLVDRPELQFSISHSGGFVAQALSLKSSVGVDLEAVSRLVDQDAIAERILSPGEYAEFQKLPESKRPAAFFRVWTAKEAYLKAMGLGLPGGLKEVAVPMEEADPSSPRIFHPDNKSAPWCFQRLPLPDGYDGCVVWDDPAKSLDFQVVNPAD
jgi:4'-phosphopantetheinyl transferase